MSKPLETIDARATNPNLDALYRHFYERLTPFFDAAGHPRPDCFEAIPCYHCGRKDVASEFVAARFRHVRCAGCGMVYVSPRLKAGLLHDSYDEEGYADYYKLKILPSLQYRREVIGWRKYDQIMRFVSGPGTVLDIGCGVGDLLSLFKDRGWTCRGIEFNRFAAAFARETFGLDVVAQSVMDLDPSGRRYDCIMLWGVLEHFTEPLAVLAKVYEMLKPEGVLVLEVPSGDSVLVRYVEQFGGPVRRIIEGDRHNMLFSVKALREMPERAGFRLLHLQSNGLDVDTVLRMNGAALPVELVGRLQAAIDDGFGGDLLRGFWRKPEAGGTAT